MTKRNKSCESEVMLTMQRKELLKKSAIRYAEYYGMVEVQDALYAVSYTHLMDLRNHERPPIRAEPEETS